MKNIGTGDIHNDHLYLNSCLDYDDLLKVDEQYQLEHNTEFGLLIEQANAKTNWRYRIARWMLRVADEFHLKRDTALIALNYFDRMMSRQVARRPIDRDCVQVAAITCLFVASKLFQKHPLKMSAVSSKLFFPLFSTPASLLVIPCSHTNDLLITCQNS